MATWLRRFQIGAACVHLVGFVAALSLLGKDRTVTLVRGYVVYPPDGSAVEYGVVPATTVSLVGLVAATFVISCIFQAVPALFLWDDTYERLYKKGINFWRWIEYSFSATTLFLAGAILSGVHSLYTFLLIFAVMWTVMVFGLLQELTAYYLRDLEHESNKRRRNPVEFFLPHLLGWVPYLFAWVVAFDTVSLDNKHNLSPTLSGFFVIEFVFYTFFAFNQQVEMVRLYLLPAAEPPGRVAVQHEWVYTGISLVAKVVGGGMLLGGGLTLSESS
jgi:hypothetical protein